MTISSFHFAKQPHNYQFQFRIRCSYRRVEGKIYVFYHFLFFEFLVNSQFFPIAFVNPSVIHFFRLGRLVL